MTTQFNFRELFREFTPQFVASVTSLLVGFALTLAGVIWLVKTAFFVIAAAEAPGVVAQIEEHPNSSEWDLTFTFSDAEGKAHTAQTSLLWYKSPPSTWRPPPIEAGDAVTVLYDHSAPEDAKVDSFGALWARPLFTLGLGLFFTIGGYVFLLALGFGAKRQKRAQNPAALNLPQ
jgi:hypothetical protein